MKKTLSSALVMLFCIFFGSSCSKEEDTPANNQPSTPTNPVPADAATNIAGSPVLSWTCSDPDAGDNLTFELFFGATNPPNTQLGSGLIQPNYTVSGLNEKVTYYWRVTAHDSHGASAVGPIWRFTTLDSLPLNILFQDDFEDYAPNTFPSSGGWVANPGTMNDAITNSVSHSPTQSFKLTGVGGDPGCYRSMTSFPEVTYFEIWMRTPAEITTADIGSVAIGIRQHFAINFLCKDKTIRITDYYTGTGTGISIDTFLPDLWYKVKVRYDKSGKKISCWINDILKCENVSIAPYSTSSLVFNCGVQNLQKEAFLDDLIVWY